MAEDDAVQRLRMTAGSARTQEVADQWRWRTDRATRMQCAGDTDTANDLRWHAARGVVFRLLIAVETIGCQVVSGDGWRRTRRRGAMSSACSGVSSGQQTAGRMRRPTSRRALRSRQTRRSD
ncbi:hypothetical protein Scep_006525 [Stephania cephalantha]|uniref:Uncharacterized protein n=1 Tax=Stephania cephalantha TaxID=152367 RepID=A0AAP0K9V2_9MAGN